MSKLKRVLSKINAIYQNAAEKHGLLITIIVCVIMVVGSGLWARFDAPQQDSVATGDTPGFVDRIAEVMNQPTFPPIATPAPTPEPRWSKCASGEVTRNFILTPVYMKTIDAYAVHLAVDIETKTGENILSPSSGKVSAITENLKFGWLVSLDIDDGTRVTIAGLAKPSVVAGQSVSRGMVIGVSGGAIPSESRDTAHIHVEWLGEDGVPRDITNKWN